LINVCSSRDEREKEKERKEKEWKKEIVTKKTNFSVGFWIRKVLKVLSFVIVAGKNF